MLSITDSTIAGNQASSAAGIFIAAGNATVTRSTVSNNSAVSGGGIFNVDGTLTMVNSTVSGNSAEGNGGGIVNTGELTLRNSTVADNTADISGGGVYNTDSGLVTAQNTIVADNNVVGTGSADFSGVVNSLGNNLIGDNRGSSGWITSDRVNFDPRLGPLANHGGPTLTHALMTGSPAIDAGNNAGAPATDQRGAPWARIFNGTLDIGAYEAQSFTFIVDSPIDLDNNNYAAGDLSVREVILLANANPGRDTIEFSLPAGVTVIDLVFGGEFLVTSDLSIHGPGASHLAISGRNVSRVFNVALGTVVEINGLTIRNRRAVEGGAIRNSGTLTIAGSAINGSTATSAGGGVYNDGGTLSITDSTISGNSAVNAGGGLYNDFGTLTIDNSTVTGNTSPSETASEGGGIFNSGEVTIQNSKILTNAAARRGGAIFNAASSELSIITSTLADNRATGFVLGIQGGGVYNLGMITITSSTISGNTASPEGSSGGGIYNQAGRLRQAG